MKNELSGKTFKISMEDYICLELAGVKFADTALPYPLAEVGQLPRGWKIMPDGITSRHLQDNRGRIRAFVFPPVEDESAGRIRALPRFDIEWDFEWQDHKPVQQSIVVRDAREVIFRVTLQHSQGVEGHTQDEAIELANRWLDRNHPESHNSAKGWD
jgi:hypothetical protein